MDFFFCTGVIQKRWCQPKIFQKRMYYYKVTFISITWSCCIVILVLILCIFSVVRGIHWMLPSGFAPHTVSIWNLISWFPHCLAGPLICIRSLFSLWYVWDISDNKCVNFISKPIVRFIFFKTGGRGDCLSEKRFLHLG